MLGNVFFTYLFALTLSILIEVPAANMYVSLLDYLFQFDHDRHHHHSKNNIITSKSPPFKNHDKKATHPSSRDTVDIELPICKEKL